MQTTTRTTVERSERAPGERGAGAFQLPTSAQERREIKRRLCETARRINAMYTNPERFTSRELATIEWAAPRKRAAQCRLTGDAVMPRRDALEREVGGIRRNNALMTRVSVVTSGPRRRIVRGYAPAPMATLTNAGRAVMVQHPIWFAEYMGL